MRSLVAILLWLAASSVHAAEGSSSAVGDARLASGLAAHYAYHYDRNALRDSRHIGDSLVALTRSGNLLRFDAKTLTLTREWFGPVAATCLGRGENDAVLVGFEDGHVCRVNPATLALADVAKLPDRVRWLGLSPRGIVAVAEPVKWIESYGRRHPFPWSVVHDLASGKTYPIEATSRNPETGKDVTYGRHATAFFLDSKHRFWLGGDRGEWGGWCVRVDLDAGRVVEVEGIKERPDEGGSGWDGVYGFAELADGQVWAHGGTMHMGFTRGFLRRVDGPKVEEIYKYGNIEARQGHENDEKIPEPSRPYLPITHILPDGDGRLVVLAYSNIYHVDTGLREWSRDQPLHIRYRPGRPDAVGAYPSIVAIHRLDRCSVFATAVDGYVSRADGKDSSHALSGQLGLDHAWRIANSAEGSLFSPWDDREPTWRHGAGSWQVADLAPPCELAPDDPYFKSENRKPTWAKTRILVGPRGTVYTVSATNGNGTITTSRRIGGKSEVLGRESSSLFVSHCFIAPDGVLWYAWYGDLRRFAEARWQRVADLPGAAPLDERGFRTGGQGLQVGNGLLVVGDAGPPWILLDCDNKQLLRLAYGPDFKDPKLDAVKLVENGASLKLHDAIPVSKGELLLATDKGLRRFNIATARVESSPLPVPDRPITSLASDGLGRVWMGGEGLWVVDADGKTLHDCAAVPMIGRTSVVTIAADPGRRDGVIVSLEERGVVFVAVSAGAAR
jgi:hypothetical protein